MENGLLILALVALLFLSMYGFAYGSIALDKLKEKKAKEKELLILQQRRDDNLKKQEVRDEKLRKVMLRRDQIKHELKLLAEQKLNHDKLTKMRIEQMQTQKVS